MFRSIISQRIQKSFGFQVLKSQYTTQPLSQLGYRHFREVNDVTLVGTLKYDSYTLPSGTKLLTVKTQDTNSSKYFSLHNIHINTDEDLVAGQRVQISGKLKSHTKQSPTGKDMTISFIKADEMLVLESESGSSSSTHKDVNTVELIGYIASNIVDKETNNNTFLLIAINYKYLDSNGREISGAHFQPVLVPDVKVRYYIRSNRIRKGDKIMVHGQIRYRPYPEDQSIMTGFIAAQDVFRIARRSKDEIEADENDALNVEN